MKTTIKEAFKLFLALVFVGIAGIILAMSFAVLTSKLAKWTFYFFLQSFAMLLLISVVSSKIYHLGFKDSNTVRIGRMREDLLRGFKIGCIAQIPAAVLLACSVAFNLRFALYRLLNTEYYWLLTAIAGKSDTMRMSSFKIVLIFLVLFIVPVISGISYYLGYKGIDLVGKFVYKKRKGN